ncbi:SPOR domain-containing protein [Algibacillus agarilyticus]|uniref:SPOR domain-containing protein n=1 Tax=Algibacillus agarilyticus TaxID=2234133 RepID=UPI000DD0B588|nr:SPOR domain-containing protein [Algibacillus agarilyticus]
MAPRDYKNRGRAQAKKPNTKKPEPKKSSAKLIFVLILTVALVGGFAYLLWSINGAAPEPVESIKTEKPKVQKPLPKKPVEQWQYIEELKEKEVKVDVPEKAISTKQYQMQCASFRQAQPADALRARVIFLGINAQVKVTDSSNGKKWHRVVLGPYKTKRDAERDKHRLQDNKINGCKIWLWNW